MLWLELVEPSLTTVKIEDGEHELCMTDQEREWTRVRYDIIQFKKDKHGNTG